MCRYFPIDTPKFTMSMDARAYAGPLAEPDPATYAAEVSQRAAILDADRDYYHACPRDVAPAAWETLDFLLADMARSYPHWFTLDRDGPALSWTNRLLGQSARIVVGQTETLAGASSPLEWLGRCLQEDLILMRQDVSDGPALCVGGVLCFAAGWALRDKLGKSLLQIHDEVPGFAASIGAPADLLLRRLKPGRTVMRCNWTLAESPELNRAPRLREAWLPLGALVTPQNAGERVFFRVEKQTLTRLPQTRLILFTIRTFVASIAETLASRPERVALLRGAVETMPPETVLYKNAGAYYEALRGYLATV